MSAQKEPETPKPDPILARMQQIQTETQQLSQHLHQATAVVQNLEAQLMMRRGALMELERLQSEEKSG
jgi:chaperonin cofactor prefoldin